MAPTDLEHKLQEYEIIFDNAIVGILYTRDRVIQRCNRRFEEMFGYGTGELQGRKTRILFRQEQDYEAVGSIGYPTLRNQRFYDYEHVMVRQDGSEFWCNVSGTALDVANPISGAIWIFQDVTQRRLAEDELQQSKQDLEIRVLQRTEALQRANDALMMEIRLRQQTEEALLESREKYRVLFEMFPLGIALCNADGRITQANHMFGEITRIAQPLGMTPQSLSRGFKWLDADGEPLPLQRFPMLRAVQEQRVVEADIGLQKDAERPRWYAVTAAPVALRQSGAVVAFIDITERRRLDELTRMQQSELNRAARLNSMGEIASTLAHELGQPLMSTLGYLNGCYNRLRDGEYQVDQMLRALATAIQLTEQSGEIVKNVHHFVRKHQPQRQPLKLDLIIADILTVLRLETRRGEVRLDIDLAEDLPELLGDRVELQQVILNLVKNGLDAMSQTPVEQRRLRISARQSDPGHVEFSVADCGTGLSDAVGQAVFEPFVTTKEDGIGLGLAICRTIIESHGGRLWYHNNKEGGATFCFTLPLEAA